MLVNFKRIGKEMFDSGLNDSHSGNMSIRLGNRMIITRSGASLHNIVNRDLIDLPLFGDDIKGASLETPIHRAIYHKTKALAVVHAHPVQAISISFHIFKIRPIDAEGLHYFPDGVPILSVNKAIASAEVAEKLPDLLANNPLVVVRGHGAFGVGKSLEDAYKLISSLENSCRILRLAQQYEERYQLP